MVHISSSTVAQADGFFTISSANIIRLLTEIGQGMYEVEHIEAIFTAEDRKAAGITPPDGLYFIHADYPAQFELPKQPLGPRSAQICLNNLFFNPPI